MPKISIIVPIYGVEKYLREAIDSILNQTLVDIEILLLDDGSKDSCPSIVDEYAKKDSRIIAIHKPNGGYGQTCNCGLKKARGEYIAILEPDDFIEANMYEDLYNIAKEYDSDIVKSGFYENLQSPLKTTLKQAKFNDGIPENKSFTIEEHPELLSYHPSIWSCIYKKEFLYKHNIKFTEAQGAGWTDNPFQVQTMCLAERINYTPKAYYYWRRTNYFETDDLKDYRIPFDRSNEIHKWLEDNNITDKKILANIYKRELNYIHLVLGMKENTNLSDSYNRIKSMLDRMKEYILSKELDRKDYEFYKKVKEKPQNIRKSLLLKRLKKELIRIKLSKKECYVVICGKIILQEHKN